MAAKLTKRQIEENLRREQELVEFQQSYNEKMKRLSDLLQFCKNSKEAEHFKCTSLVPVLNFDSFGQPRVFINIPFAYMEDWVLPINATNATYDTISEYHSMLAEVEEYVTIINSRIAKENKIKEIQSKMRETFTKEELELIGIK